MSLKVYPPTLVFGAAMFRLIAAVASGSMADVAAWVLAK